MYQNQALGIQISHKIRSQLSQHKKVTLLNCIEVTGTQTTDAKTWNGYTFRQHSSEANSGMAVILLTYEKM